jgi:4-amino-4-deoxy-L-arabinose transferase-like glycosyltransferase
LTRVYRRSPLITASVTQIQESRDSSGVSAIAPGYPGDHRAPERGGPARYQLFLILLSGLVFLGCLISLPSLMDDVDAAHGSLARNMIESGDWVIPHLDGVAYVEKPPLPYWMIAGAFRIFGVHDWAARVPFALAAMLLCVVVSLYGRWAFSHQAGLYAGMVLATCVGLFLFTRVLIPDVMVTLCVCLCFWSFQRALNEDQDEPHPQRWAALLAAVMGVGVLLKGLIALVFPVGGALAYLGVTGQLLKRETWRRLHPIRGLCIFLVIAAPWHILAMLRMPPYFDFTTHSGPGQYHGFFWFYFMNEHVLRFLGLRYPHDYNTVPRLAFWLLNLLWLFPWSFFLPAAARLNYKPVDRPGRTRLLALCWIGFLMLFFSLSTTQEYYSMPIYPALALLLGCAMSEKNESGWIKAASKTLGVVSGLAVAVIGYVLYSVRQIPAPGDISHALQQHPDAYTLSLGHAGDLTLQSFAYLRGPLILAGIAFSVGAAGVFLLRGRRVFFALAAMMVLFFHASRLALVAFDPYLSSRPLAEALRRAPEGQLIVDGGYYAFSSVFFYTGRSAYLLNGRVNNLEYGSYAPGAPSVFIDDERFVQLWSSSGCYYLVADGGRVEPLRRLTGPDNLHPAAESGGKFLFVNHPAGEPGSCSAGENPSVLEKGNQGKGNQRGL